MRYFLSNSDDSFAPAEYDCCYVSRLICARFNVEMTHAAIHHKYAKGLSIEEQKDAFGRLGGNLIDVRIPSVGKILVDEVFISIFS